MESVLLAIESCIAAGEEKSTRSGGTGDAALRSVLRLLGGREDGPATFADLAPAQVPALAPRHLPVDLPFVDDDFIVTNGNEAAPARCAGGRRRRRRGGSKNVLINPGVGTITLTGATCRSWPTTRPCRQHRHALRRHTFRGLFVGGYPGSDPDGGVGDEPGPRGSRYRGAGAVMVAAIGGGGGRGLRGALFVANPDLAPPSVTWP